MTIFQNLDLAQQKVRTHVASSVPGLTRPKTSGAAAGATGASGSAMNEEDVE